MTYIAEKSIVQQSTRERQLITIEFAPKVHPDETEYQYKHPKFVFGDRVIMVNCFPATEYTICALELREFKTESGRLLNQPYWKYKITNGEVSFWKESSALVRSKNSRSSNIYSVWPHFNDFLEPNSRDWLQQFEQPARTHRFKNDNRNAINTDDQILELDRDGHPMDSGIDHACFEIDSIVKVIDADEHHTEWATFVVICSDPK